MVQPPLPAAPYVFLSYASADRARALRIADLLEGAGVPVWIDRHSIAGGATWSAEIVRGVKGCTALIVLCSPASMASPNVHRELNLAVEENRPILPLLLERTALPDEVRYALAGRQWVEVLDLPDATWWPQTGRALAGLGLSVAPVVAAPVRSPADSTAPSSRPPTRSAVPAPPPSSLSRSGNTSPLSRLLTRAPLVGRTAELAYLREEYDAAAGGQGGRLVFISGEPGAGKTRLAQEIGAYARERGGIYLEGHYLRDGTAAYGPWVEALRGGLRAADPAEVLGWLGGYGPDLAQVVPDLVDGLAQFPAPPALAPDEQRRRLFEGFAGLIAGLSQKVPLVLLLDDLQWSSGLALLQHVARRLGDSRALIVGTYRDQEFREQPGLMRDWAELNRARLATEITLHLLTEGETRELIGHYFGTAAAALGDAVYQRTRGNAFFTEEVLRSLTETGAVQATADGWAVADPGKVAIPESMRLAVEERVARLGDQAREILTQAAVLGQEFSFSVLRALTGLGEEVLIEIIDRVVAARLLVDRSVGGEERFAFLDDQMQEVLYGSISPLRRRRYHLRAGQTIETIYADRLDVQLEELARHFAQGADIARAADYAYRAAEKNARVFNWPRARALYEPAEELLGQLAATKDTNRRRVDSLLKLVSVVHANGELDRSLDWLERAEVLARTSSDSGEQTGLLAHVWFWMGRVHYFQGHYIEARKHFEDAHVAAERAHDQDLTLLSSSAIGRLLYWQGHFGEALRRLAGLVGPLDQTSNDWEWTYLVCYLGMAKAGTGDYSGGCADGERAIERARLTNNPRSLAVGFNALAAIHWSGEDHRLTWEFSRAAEQTALNSGEQFWSYAAIGTRMWAKIRLNQLDAARESLTSLRILARRLGGQLAISDWLAAAEAELAFNAGNFAEAAALAGQARAQASSMGSILSAGLAERVWGQAVMGIDPDRRDEAEAHFAASLRLFEEGEARLEAARTRVAWGRLLQASGDIVAAREHLEQAAAQFEASGLAEELERTRGLLSDLA